MLSLVARVLLFVAAAITSWLVARDATRRNFAQSGRVLKLSRSLLKHCRPTLQFSADGLASRSARSNEWRF